MSRVGLTFFRQMSGRQLIGRLVVSLVLAGCGGAGVTDVSTTRVAPSTTATPTESTSTSAVPAGGDGAGAGAISLRWVDADISGETSADQVLATDDGYVAYLHGQQAWTSVDGREWTEQELVVESEDEVFFTTDVIVTASGYVALGSTFDGDTLLLTSPDGFRWTADPIELEQPDVSDFVVESVLATRSGSLVFTGSFIVDDADGHHHETLIWVSEDSESWDLVSVPFQPEGFFQILSTGNALVAYSDPGILWASSDGVVWEELSIDDLDAGPISYPGPALWGDTLIVAIFDAEEGVRFLTSTDGREWSQLPTHELLEDTDDLTLQPGFGSIAAGPYGIALIGSLQPVLPPEPDVIIEKDGLTLTVHVETFTFTLADGGSGVVLSEGTIFDNPSVEIPDDGDTITFLDPDTGERLTAVTGEEFDQARQEAYEEAGVAPPDEQDFIDIPTLWFSPDGQRWASVPTDEITGQDNSIEQVIVGQESIVVRVLQHSDFDEGSDLIWAVTFSEDQ